MPRLALATLGDVALFDGERRCDLPSTAKARLLLVYLAMHAGRPVSRDELAAIGWPESDEDRARASLSTALWAIRKTLADAGAAGDALVAGRSAVTFAADIAVDALRFEQAAAAGDDAEADRLYAGPFLRDEYGDWAIAQRERLAQLAESVLGRLLVRAPDPLAARRLLSSDPYAELAYRVLIDDALARGRFATARAYAKRATDAFAELGATPPFAAEEPYAALFGDAASDRQRTNLGLETTSFIGRDEDLVHVAGLLDEHRLVTLLGPGGTGKTRLAREVALRAVARHAEGAWFVDLAPLAENADIDVAVLRALGLREEPGRGAAGVLDEALAERDVLIVLDNCEHVVDAVAEVVARVLPLAPLARFLATSREPLRLAGEWLVDVAPLVIGDALALFAERARAADRRFVLGNEPARALVREICSTLDGLPLAIELAAARVRYDPLESIRASLHDEPTGPAGTLRNVAPRAHSLRSSIAWSVDRLESAARTVFGRAGIFAGAFDESGLVAVAGDGTRGALDTLVGRSLVATVDVRGRRRYRLLETTRAYAREFLARDPDVAAVRTAYARDVLEHAMAARERLLGAGAPAALLELDDATPDVTAALEILYAAGPEAAPDVVNAVYRLARYWNERGAHAHAEAWFARASLLDVAPNLRGELAYARSLLRGTARDSAAMEAALREALAWFERAGDVAGQARSWNGLGIVHENRHQYDSARSAFERSVALQRIVGDRVGVAFALSNLAVLAIEGQDYAAAERFYDEALPIFDAATALSARVNVYVNVARVKRHLGAGDVADRALATALALAEKTGSADTLAFAYTAAACQAAGAGEFELAESRAARVATLAAPLTYLSEALLARACALHHAGDDALARRCLAASLAARERCGEDFEALERGLVAGLPLTVDPAAAATAEVLDDGDLRALLREAAAPAVPAAGV